jgi:HlyD family secretion protein
MARFSLSFGAEDRHMDVPRIGVAERKRKRRIVWVGAGIVALGMGTVALSRLKPAAPSVERGTVWMGKVERGPMVRQVRGSGTLVPEIVRLIPATTSARVERRVLEPGAPVTPDSVILVLSDPQVEQEAIDAEMQLRRTEAELVSLRVQLENEALDQQAGVAAADAQYEQARLRAEADRELAKAGLISDITLKSSIAGAEALRVRAEMDRRRLAATGKGIEAQLAAKKAEVDQRRAMYELRRQTRENLQVRAGLSGVLQEITVEVGQQVAPGANLARVADPSHLMARIHVPATQARDVMVGQTAEVDTRNGVITANVARVDPAVHDGTVTVDLALTGALPRGARPDLNVDGTVEIERLENVVFVGRPAFGQEGSTVGLFRLEPDGVHATRVKVRLGRASVSTIEVLEGLKPGDEVILSDTSRWDEVDRIRLN